MKFRLKSDHYFDELSLLLPEGTIIEQAVGKRTGIGPRAKVIIEKKGKVTLPRPIVDINYPAKPGMPQAATVTELETSWIGPPSVDMEGLDDEARAACDKRQDTYMSINDLPITPEQEARRRQQ